MQTTTADDAGWSRRRLAGTAASIVVLLVLALTGIGLAVLDIARPAPDATTTSRVSGDVGSGTTSSGADDRRDHLAADPMLPVSASAAWPPVDGAPSGVKVADPFVLPTSSNPGPAGVPSGFPHTIDGAVAQLAALTQAALQSPSPQALRDVQEAWSIPGQRQSGEWQLDRDVASFREAAGVSDSSSVGLVVEAEPAAGMVKGSDGPDWVLACVLMHVRATYRDTGEVAYGSCAAMQWSSGRWMLDLSRTTASAPSTWPGTPAAARAGWHPTTWDARGGSLSPSAPRSEGVSQGPGAISTGTAARIDIDIPNPLTELGGVVSGAAADAWTSAMLAVWSAGLMVLRIVLTYADLILTPDLGADGPGRNAYIYTFWIASVLVVLMLLIQLGASVSTRKASSLARAAIGAAQFVLVWSCWLGYCVVVVTACGSLSHALMGPLLGVDSWNAWDPVEGLETADVTDSVVATVLGLLGCVLWLAAIGHLLVMLARAASLIVLVATGPIAAAGLVADAGRSWFWKSLRWFHAAALTPVLMVLVMGIGTQVSTGVATGLTDTTQQAVGTALPAVLLLCVACVAPMALFKLLAFVDPGTSSGASFRQGMAAQGGLQGLLPGGDSSGGGGDAAASATDQHGRAEAEGGAESATSDRFAASTQSALGRFGGGIGQAVSTGMGAVQKVGGLGASLLADESNQAGVGHHTYGPDFSSLSSGPRRNSPGSKTRVTPGDQDDPEGLHLPMPPVPSNSPGSPAAGASLGAGDTAAAGAAIPPVPV